MNNKAFTLTEILVVLGLIILTALIVIPNLIEDNKKLDIISKWKNTYQNIEYVFSALNAQNTETDVMAFKKAKSVEEKENLLIELLNPYFRIIKPISADKKYKLYYLNGSEVKPEDDYNIKKFYEISSGKIIGIKWLNTASNLTEVLPVALISIDLNGENKPNKWGYDVFGVNIFEGKIEPVGKSNDEFLMKSDCSKKGKGISCSYYYYIYGGQLN